MNILAYSELNAFALLVLLIIFVNIYNVSQQYLFEQKLFLGLLILNAALLLLDTFQWLLNGRPGVSFRLASIIIAAIYSALTPAPCFIWSLYADYQVYQNKERIKKLFVPMIAPIFINIIISLLSVFYGFTFKIDQNNIYHRGCLFYFMAAICYLYFIYSFIFVIYKRKSLAKKAYISLLLFVLPPFIGGIVQSLFYGVSIIWACTTLSILIIFINIQSNQLNTDYLTGLYNRRQFDKFMLEWLKNCKEGAVIGGIMADLDSFKQINDVWGHLAGDTALVEAGNILKASFGKENLICRYGGDEFLVALKISGMNDLACAVENFRANIKEFNERSTTPYCINFSVGYDVFDPKTGMPVQQFIKHIDNLMYDDKKREKIR
jgi:diguanylate cyclase (GGDEF) domain